MNESNNRSFYRDMMVRLSVNRGHAVYQIGR